MLSSPEAIDAVRAEARGLEEVGTWDLNSVRERDDVSESRRAGVKVHFGQLMSIASQKFAELAEHLRKMKGRIVFRGDIGKDEYGAAAVYQDMAANPTSVQGLNSCLAYGSLPGHKHSTADAIKAYVQALLKSKYATWIELPPELRPAWWRNNFVKPVVLLIKSLYGHPEAGAHWGRHLDVVLRSMGGVPSSTFPGNYYFPATRLSLSVYVDDFTFAGPIAEHEGFWTELTEDVSLDPPEDIGRVLGDITT